jgi:23S rRNA pseudouridine2605 synthase
MALREGKNREVRRVLEHLGLQVTRLIRLSYGPFQLGNLARGAVDEVPKKVLSEQLGTAGPAHADRRR